MTANLTDIPETLKDLAYQSVEAHAVARDAGLDRQALAADRAAREAFYSAVLDHFGITHSKAAATDTWRSIHGEDTSITDSDTNEQQAAKTATQAKAQEMSALVTDLLADAQKRYAAAHPPVAQTR